MSMSMSTCRARPIHPDTHLAIAKLPKIASTPNSRFTASPESYSYSSSCFAAYAPRYTARDCEAPVPGYAIRGRDDSTERLRAENEQLREEVRRARVIEEGLLKEARDTKEKMLKETNDMRKKKEREEFRQAVAYEKAQKAKEGAAGKNAKESKEGKRVHFKTRVLPWRLGSQHETCVST